MDLMALGWRWLTAESRPPRECPRGLPLLQAVSADRPRRTIILRGLSQQPPRAAQELGASNLASSWAVITRARRTRAVELQSFSNFQFLKKYKVYRSEICFLMSENHPFPPPPPPTFVSWKNKQTFGILLRKCLTEEGVIGKCFKAFLL